MTIYEITCKTPRAARGNLWTYIHASNCRIPRALSSLLDSLWTSLWSYFRCSCQERRRKKAIWNCRAFAHMLNTMFQSSLLIWFNLFNGNVNIPLVLGWNWYDMEISCLCLAQHFLLWVNDCPCLPFRCLLLSKIGRFIGSLFAPLIRLFVFMTHETRLIFGKILCLCQR